VDARGGDSRRLLAGGGNDAAMFWRPVRPASRLKTIAVGSSTATG
jgi:hypothetical protein